MNVCISPPSTFGFSEIDGQILPSTKTFLLKMPFIWVHSHLIGFTLSIQLFYSVLCQLNMVLCIQLLPAPVSMFSIFFMKSQTYLFRSWSCILYSWALFPSPPQWHNFSDKFYTGWRLLSLFWNFFLALIT